MNQKKFIQLILISLPILFFYFTFANGEIDEGIRSKNRDAKTVDLFTPLISFDTSRTKAVSIKLDSLLRHYNKMYDFHGSVLVAKWGKILFNEEYGFSNFKNKTLIDSSSAFQTASLSKQFTAAAVLMLYEKNHIALDDTLTQYFPDFPYKQITIRQLLNHTSGLPKYFWLAEHKWTKKNPPLNSEMMAMFAEHDLPLFFYPGRLFDYSNSGYMVLASLVAKVSGISFGDYLDTHIFKPLNMTNSFVFKSGDTLRSNQLQGYRIYKKWYHLRIPGTVNDGIVGDKNIYSTAEDLLKWINALNAGKVISKKTLSLMYTKGKTRYGREVPYGFGFRIREKDNNKLIYHAGKWNGFRAYIKQYPAEETVVILLEHSSYNALSFLAQKIKTIVDNSFKYEKDDLFFYDFMNSPKPIEHLPFFRQGPLLN